MAIRNLLICQVTFGHAFHQLTNSGNLQRLGVLLPVWKRSVAAAVAIVVISIILVICNFELLLPGEKLFFSKQITGNVK